MKIIYKIKYLSLKIDLKTSFNIENEPLYGVFGT